MTDQQSLPSNPDTDSPQVPDDLWRTEISSRVAGYRHRRGRRVEGAFSMRFPFPPAPAQETPAPELELSRADQADARVPDAFIATSVAVTALEPPTAPPSEYAAIAAEESQPDISLEEAEAVPQIDDIAPEPDPPRAPAAPRPRGKRKIIAFPRQASLAPEGHHRLADPIVPEQPRILDVPEELEAFPCAPLLDGLHLPLNSGQAATPVDHIELPFQAVSIPQRLGAGLIDCALVAASAAAFGAVCYKMLPKLTLTKPILIVAGVLPVLLWATYQYMLTMYGGATIGMRALHMRLSTFKGGAPNWRHRRSRVIGLYFSAASLAMGLLWALVDVDALCWHDRISRTYLTRSE